VVSARLGFWQAIWGTIFTGGIAVAIPAAVDWYKTHEETKLKTLEIALKNKDLEQKVLDSHEPYVSAFLNTALNQDIELRIRFSEYFAHVSDTRYRESWERFRTTLDKRRSDIRAGIDEMEMEADQLRAKRNLNIDELIKLAKLERELGWKYAEVGYYRRDSNVSARNAAADADYGKDFYGALEPVTPKTLLDKLGPPSTSADPNKCNEKDALKLNKQLVDVRSQNGDVIRLLRPASESLSRVLSHISAAEPELARTLTLAPDLCAFYLQDEKRFIASSWGVSVFLGGIYAPKTAGIVTVFETNAGLKGYDPDSLLKLLTIAKYFKEEKWYWGGGDPYGKRVNYFIVSSQLFDEWQRSNKFNE
jgi:hypothetical protein